MQIVANLSSTLAFLGSDNKQKTTAKYAELIAEFRKVPSAFQLKNSILERF
jgi:aminoglycoside N3'-acetyltransferase